MKKFLTVAGMHRLLYVYNGAVVFVLMAFMCLTQDRINRSMAARSFLEQAGAIPTPAPVIFFYDSRNVPKFGRRRKFLPQK